MIVIFLLAGSHTMLPISPRSRNANRNIPGSTDHITSPPQHSPGYNSISALEAMTSSNGFSLASNNSSQNVNIPNSSKMHTKSSSPKNQWTLQESYKCRTDITQPNHVLGSEHPVEMIDLNSQFSVDKTTLEDVQNIGYDIDSIITETTIQSGVSYPATKKSKKNHMNKTLGKANKQHDQDVGIYEMDIRHDISTCNNQSENVPETPKKLNSSTIDLNNSVDLVYLDGDQSHDIKIGSGLTPLKELQLCIPKLVITKIKERRGSKEIETHSVRTVMPGEEEDFILRKKRRRSCEEGDKQSDAEIEKGIALL